MFGGGVLSDTESLSTLLISDGAGSKCSKKQKNSFDRIEDRVRQYKAVNKEDSLVAVLYFCNPYLLTLCVISDRIFLAAVCCDF